MALPIRDSLNLVWVKLLFFSELILYISENSMSEPISLWVSKTTSLVVGNCFRNFLYFFSGLLLSPPTVFSLIEAPGAKTSVRGASIFPRNALNFK